MLYYLTSKTRNKLHHRLFELIRYTILKSLDRYKIENLGKSSNIYEPQQYLIARAS
ncbi:hypothetical protein KNP414_01690 [Paenibacillus mucilaginosus KNP414]|uniref:Uncharacterized protein n=1 Tax=Paenibacillus mucilaginosus (strain KNP414) TaxID=1036673 RepID=F8FPM8_PAEMK|nr:hypothetical protein KNP414_01690 [Paenibacillus mucilaginosus KNP414]